jgi:hypothetical protein
LSSSSPSLSLHRTGYFPLEPNRRLLRDGADTSTLSSSSPSLSLHRTGYFPLEPNRRLLRDGAGTKPIELLKSLTQPPPHGLLPIRTIAAFYRASFTVISALPILSSAQRSPPVVPHISSSSPPASSAPAAAWAPFLPPLLAAWLPLREAA